MSKGKPLLRYFDFLGQGRNRVRVMVGPDVRVMVWVRCRFKFTARA